MTTKPKLSTEQRKRLATLYESIRSAKREIAEVCTEAGLAPRKDTWNHKALSAWKEFGA